MELWKVIAESKRKYLNLGSKSRKPWKRKVIAESKRKYLNLGSKSRKPWKSHRNIV